MDDLIAFLEEQLAGDEQRARAAVLALSDVGQWTASGVGDPRVLPSVWSGSAVVARELADEHAVHIGRWDPDLVLALIGVLRRAVDEFCHEGRETWIVRAVGEALYGRDPGWREHWRP